MEERCSLDGLVFLVFPESQETDGGDLANSEPDTWQITDGVTLPTESSDEHFVVLINEGETAIARNHAGDSLVVLLKLYSNALTDGGVGLLGLDGNLLDHDAGGVGGAGEGLLPLGSSVLLAVFFVMPFLKAAVSLQLATSLNTTGLVTSHF